jgi:hypothetical protein
LVSVTGYAFPWDFIDDPGALARTQELDVDVVALAGSYHATRVVNTFHPTRRVTDIPYSAFYGTRRDGAWRGHRLTPRVPSWLGHGDALATSAQLLTGAGIGVDAWIVLTHVDDPEFTDLELVERNAYGEHYPYALCPASEDVREYCLTLVDETLRSADVRGVVLEASGPMGFDHAGVHDKSGFATLSVAQRQLLSLCFCAACRKGQQALGLDPDEIATKVRVGIDDDASTPEAALGSELADALAGFRVALGTELRDSIIQRVRDVRPEATITVHASAQRWATGSFPALGAQPWSSSITAVVSNAWDPASAEDELRAMASVVKGRAAVGAYLRLDRDWSGGGNDATLRRYVRAGLTELHLYHLGLFTKESSRAARNVVECFREIAPRRNAGSS